MRVWTDQYLVGIESIARLGVVRPIDAERIQHPRDTAAHEDVPEMKGLVGERIEPYQLEWLEIGRRFEQQEDDFSGALGEERKVHALRIGRDAERVGRPRLSYEAC